MNERALALDDGTAWEIGFAYGRNVPVYGLRTDTRIVQQLATYTFMSAS